MDGTDAVSFIDDLIEHGANFNVRRGDGTVSFRPASGRDEDIDAFQGVVRELVRNEGAGYSIELQPVLRDRSVSAIDLVIVKLER